MHNTMFKQQGLPYTYIKTETDEVEKVRQRFRSLSIKPSFSAGRTELLFARSLSQVRQAIRAPEFGGASVTIPLKVAVIPLLDHVTDIAHKIGAVNTIFRDKDGSVLNNI